MPQPRFHRLVPALILEGPEPPPSEVPEPELEPEPEEELEPDPEPLLEEDPDPELEPEPEADPELESPPPSAPSPEELEEELPQAARTPAARRATYGAVPVSFVVMASLRRCPDPEQKARETHADPAGHRSLVGAHTTSIASRLRGDLFCMA
ncbi:MAG TPA: hypothetical protein VMI75_34795 [Polyangiaceae bacterium]|nr:hypothetical protein [Polyangiaceae bacterium]